MSTQVVDQFRERIAGNLWPPGFRIPSELQLTQSLGISRNTVREALRSLVHSGLLEARVGDGTYVTAHSELQVALGRRIQRDSSADAVELRLILERNGARLAALRATPAQHTLIAATLSLRDESSTTEEFIERDLAFHRAVVEASGNALLAEIYRDLDEVSRSIGEVVNAPKDFSTFLSVAQDLNDKHHQLLSAIKNGDSELSSRIADEIIGEARSVRHLNSTDSL